MSRLQQITSALATEGERRERRNELWIKLYSVLVDIGSSYCTILTDQRNDAFLRALANQSGQVQSLVELLGRLDGEVQQAVIALNATLTRDELITVEYLRACAGHVFQDAYWLSLKARPCRILGGTKLSPLEADRAISNYTAKYCDDTAKYGEDESIFAVEIATRIAPKVDALVPPFQQIRSAALDLVLRVGLTGQLPFAPEDPEEGLED